MKQRFTIGTITEGKVVRIIEKGLIAELPEGVDGFVPANQLSTSKLKNLANHFPVDDVIPIKVIEFDKSNKKIVLSTIAALKDKPDNEIEDYLNKHKLDKVSLDSIKNADTGEIDSSEFPIFEVQDNQEAKKTENPE